MPIVFFVHITIVADSCIEEQTVAHTEAAISNHDVYCPPPRRPPFACSVLSIDVSIPMSFAVRCSSFRSLYP
ncbi:hypothetical protein QR680_002021 [Steinernema hermaphroditum]|uniref:Uncharacterized protein n=1 Tax=Steinernema hermaphroditum TaxID=289476 RepID=A0AA39H1S6_9BILA|nr:hypothetical protein QR680_002021 [Steinernema hermaphroditum]